MGDNETLIAQSSTVMDYTSEGQVTAGYTGGVPGEFPAAAGGTDSAGYGADLSSGVEASQVGVDVAYGSKVDDGSGDVAQQVAVDLVQNAAGYGSANGSVGGEGEVDVLPAVNGSVPQQHAPDGSVQSLSAEEERLWNIVRTNSLDFNAWTALIEETEKVAENNMARIRKVYDAFLSEFPLCYGYWKKYADHEARVGSIDKVVEVYERAIQGVTYSVDMWLHYSLFAVSTYGDPDTVRRLFERGLAYVGTDYLSYPIWDRYIEYEYSQQDWGRLAMIYTRILENPIQQLDRYFNSFKELAGSRPLSELKSAEEAALGTAGASSEAEGQVNGGEIHVDDSKQSAAESANDGLTDADELQKYIAIREEMYKKAKEFESKIIDFETGIRRPYFHVKPLSDAELDNWQNYLDFIEREADFSKVVKLYERCLIACANYPEFWMRYILSMQARGSMDLAENALARATQVFVKRQPEIHLFAARFKEENEDILGARAAYQLVHTEIAPGLIEAIVKHASMEYRLGNVEDACSLYEQTISIEKGKEHSQILPMLYAQYSRFVCLVCQNAEKAREILNGALEHVQMSKPILEAIIYLESIQSLPKRIDYLDSLVDKFIMPNPDGSCAASDGEKEELSSIFLEFLYLFGDTQSIKKASDRHAKLFLHHRSTSESRKRHADDFLASDKAKAAKSYTTAPAQSVMGAYTSAQNPWGATYGVQAQTWPQATQAQAQQWPAGYAPQNAYSGYAYGTGYSTPQLPASLPQGAPYGAYPSTYSAQAVPQQSYAQPAAAGAGAGAGAGAAAAAVAAPQVSSAQQAYYGSYY